VRCNLRRIDKSEKLATVTMALNDVVRVLSDPGTLFQPILTLIFLELILK